MHHGNILATSCPSIYEQRAGYFDSDGTRAHKTSTIYEHLANIWTDWSDPKRLYTEDLLKCCHFKKLIPRRIQANISALSVCFNLIRWLNKSKLMARNSLCFVVGRFGKNQRDREDSVSSLVPDPEIKGSSVYRSSCHAEILFCFCGHPLRWP